MQRQETIPARRLTPLDPAWPSRLDELHDPPAVLFARGNVRLFHRPMVAIVGARRSTSSGREIARRLARDLTDEGLCVVSGMARGIDTAGHRGALDVGGGTIAVLGCGIDVCYPTDSRDVYDRLPREGLLLTEFEADAPPRPSHFPQRNRIIAALASAVVVVEGGEKSGSRITADLALDLGREVLAVPRDPLQSGAEMPNRLLKTGAAPVTCADDVLAALGILRPEPGPAPGGKKRARLDRDPNRPLPDRLRWLADALEAAPTGIDELVGVTGRSATDVLGGLSDLELRGWVERVGPGLFRRRAGG